MKGTSRQFFAFIQDYTLAKVTARLACANDCPQVPFEIASNTHGHSDPALDIWESDDELAEFLADLRVLRTLALG